MVGFFKHTDLLQLCKPAPLSLRSPTHCTKCQHEITGAPPSVQISSYPQPDGFLTKHTCSFTCESEILFVTSHAQPKQFA